MMLMKFSAEPWTVQVRTWLILQRQSPQKKLIVGWSSPRPKPVFEFGGADYLPYLAILRCIDSFTTPQTRISIVTAARGADGLTPLTMACRNYCDISVFDKLVNLGANAGGTDRNDCGLLHRAVMAVNHATERLNIAAYRLRIAEDRRRIAEIIREHAAQARYRRMLDDSLRLLRAVAQLYRDERRSFNERDRGGLTPAHLVAQGGCLRALEHLITYSGGRRPRCIHHQIRTPNGHSVYGVALANGHMEMERYIRHNHTRDAR